MLFEQSSLAASLRLAGAPPLTLAIYVATRRFTGEP
jgi:hypothetical protein